MSGSYLAGVVIGSVFRCLVVYALTFYGMGLFFRRDAKNPARAVSAGVVSLLVQLTLSYLGRREDLSTSFIVDALATTMATFATATVHGARLWRTDGHRQRQQPPDSANPARGVAFRAIGWIVGFGFVFGVQQFIRSKNELSVDSVRQSTFLAPLESGARDRIARAAFDAHADLLESPEYRAALRRYLNDFEARTGAKVRGGAHAEQVGAAFGAELAARGTPALGVRDLERRSELMIKLSEQDINTCALIGRGAVGPEGTQLILQGLERFSDDELRDWFRISRQATEFALRNVRPPIIDESILQSGLQRISSQVEPAQRERFERALDDASAATDQDICFATLALYRGAFHLGEPERTNVFRAFVSP